MNYLDRLMQGSIDMHMHTAPDTMPMRLDALEAAQQARDKGMRAIVLKNHFYTTAPLATLVSRMVSDVHVFGSICLDYEIGCLNHHALKVSAELGAKVVWMATLSSANSRGKISKSLNLGLEGEGYSILNKRGELVPEIDRILSIIKEHDMVLASGHISPKETFALFDKARVVGIQKLVVTHASNAEVVEEALSLDDQKQLVDMGAFIEHTAVDIMPADFGHTPADIVEAIKAVGAENCILSSDMGMAHSLFPAEGMRLFVSTLLRHKISSEDIEVMIKKNPSELLGLEK